MLFPFVAAGAGRVPERVPERVAALAPAGAGARVCNPARCTLARPTATEYAAIVADADRMLATYAADTSALGRQCYALGRTMRERAGDVRIVDYMWREVDADGNVGPVTGDAHPRELAAGTGTVHIARGYNPLNPDRGLPAILQTARHEFAHLNGLRQNEGGFDAAAWLATACGPSQAAGAPGARGNSAGPGFDRPAPERQAPDRP